MEKEKKAETYSYKGWLISDSFIKRSFGSLGYQIMGTLFIYIILLAVGMVVWGIAWAVSSLF